MLGQFGKIWHSCRSENGLGGDLPDVKSLPCDQPGCKKGVKGKILAFSALHDVTLKEVSYSSLQTTAIRRLHVIVGQP